MRPGPERDRSAGAWRPDDRLAPPEAAEDPAEPARRRIRTGWPGVLAGHRSGRISPDWRPRPPSPDALGGGPARTRQRRTGTVARPATPPPPHQAQVRHAAVARTLLCERRRVLDRRFHPQSLACRSTCSDPTTVDVYDVSAGSALGALSAPPDRIRPPAGPSRDFYYPGHYEANRTDARQMEPGTERWDTTSTPHVSTTHPGTKNGNVVRIRRIR
jgi:hypothetical protein